MFGRHPLPRCDGGKCGDDRACCCGPFGDDGHWRGLLLFDLAEVDDAEAAIATDPAVQAGRLKFECHPWWGAKGTSLK